MLMISLCSWGLHMPSGQNNGPSSPKHARVGCNSSLELASVLGFCGASECSLLPMLKEGWFEWLSGSQPIQCIFQCLCWSTNIQKHGSRGIQVKSKNSQKQELFICDSYSPMIRIPNTTAQKVQAHAGAILNHELKSTPNITSRCPLTLADSGPKTT